MIFALSLSNYYLGLFHQKMSGWGGCVSRGYKIWGSASLKIRICPGGGHGDKGKFQICQGRSGKSSCHPQTFFNGTAIKKNPPTEHNVDGNQYYIIVNLVIVLHPFL
jgi:hypothetical protein